jgi:2-C-methyl-D-erythritol 4-phosphate cytidylyltransferase
MTRIAVIVVAAGRGERFGGNENKIFAQIDGQPMCLRALQLFANREDVCQTLLVVSPADMERMKTRYGPNLGFMGTKLVEGGEERWQSVANGLAAVDDEAEFVAVHDAARVCLAEQWIDRIFETAVKQSSAVPVTPVDATLKKVGSDGTISETISRDGLYLAQTPQVFAKAVIQAAYDQLARNNQNKADVPPTDDAQVVAAAGHPVATVVSDARNIKITTKGDLSLAAAILKSLPQKPVSRRGAFEEAQW